VPRQSWLGRILKVAEANHGLVSTSTATLAHISPYQLATATRLGVIEPILPRVYRLVGPQGTRQQDVLAAQMWGAPECAASHWTAAELHGLDLTLGPEIHVTTTRHVESPVESLIVHPRAFLRAGDTCNVQGITWTEPMRTLIDLAALVKPHVWESALDAFVRRGLDIDHFFERFEATAIQGRTGTRWSG
jgi:predicted transcriptional regulator of viral defense system